LSEGCTKALSAVQLGFGRGILLSALATGIADIHFVHGQAGEAEVSLASVTGLPVSRVGTGTVGEYFARLQQLAGQAGAGTILAATLGRGIILASSYYTLTWSEQIAVLVHEAAHIVRGEVNDVRLAQFLGISGYDPSWQAGSLADQGKASNAIHEWFLNGCK